VRTGVPSTAVGDAGMGESGVIGGSGAPITGESVGEKAPSTGERELSSRSVAVLTPGASNGRLGATDCVDDTVVGRLPDAFPRFSTHRNIREYKTPRRKAGMTAAAMTR